MTMDKAVVIAAPSIPHIGIKVAFKKTFKLAPIKFTLSKNLDFPILSRVAPLGPKATRIKKPIAKICKAMLAFT